MVLLFSLCFILTAIRTIYGLISRCLEWPSARPVDNTHIVENLWERDGDNLFDADS